MKPRCLLFLLSCSGTVLASSLLVGCGSRDARAEQAFNDYESAMNSGNPLAAREALLKAVAARDDVAEYWEDLGQLQLQLGSLSDADYAFTRAHELDSGNPQVLAALSQLSLVGGDLEGAQGYERALESVAPQDPRAKLVKGYIHLVQREFDAADQEADDLLQDAPLDPEAKLLKARILVARGDRDAAVALLEQQAAAKPKDVGSAKALIILLERADDWGKLAAAAAHLASLRPGDEPTRLTAIEAAFRANNVPMAAKLSYGLLAPASPPQQVASVLRLWAKYWRNPAGIQQAIELAKSAPPQQRLAYATYFNSVGRPGEAAALAGGAPQLPITLANSSSNAIYAEALAVGGKPADARRLLNAVLDREPDHVYALRARARIEISMGDGTSAVRDAQRLVTIEPNSPDDRLLLAQAHVSAGDQRSADRALWDAFHDIPDNDEIYRALRVRLAVAGGADATRQLDDEFNHQRDQQLAREFI
jgi:Flp pilus assembly protein TadD